MKTSIASPRQSTDEASCASMPNVSTWTPSPSFANSWTSMKDAARPRFSSATFPPRRRHPRHPLRNQKRLPSSLPPCPSIRALHKPPLKSLSSHQPPFPSPRMFLTHSRHRMHLHPILSRRRPFLQPPSKSPPLKTTPFGARLKFLRNSPPSRQPPPARSFPPQRRPLPSGILRRRNRTSRRSLPQLFEGLTSSTRQQADLPPLPTPTPPQRRAPQHPTTHGRLRIPPSCRRSTKTTARVRRNASRAASPPSPTACSVPSARYPVASGAKPF